MSFPRYKKTKPSGVEWLGEVPEHWEVRPLKKLAALKTGITPPSDDLENYAEDVCFQWVRPEDLEESGAPTTASRFLSAKGWSQVRPIPAGSSLICCIGTIGKVGIATAEVSTNQQITAASFHWSTRYFYFALTAGRTPMEVESTGNVLRILNTERLGRIAFPSPPEAEANLIAAFLDRETAKIDELVAEQRRLMELLKEKRQAVISHAVTQGLNPKAPIKPSGIEWLGDVPKHWKVKKIKHLSNSIEQGWSPQCEGFPAEAENEWGVLKVGCVNGGVFNSTENKLLPTELEPIPCLALSRGDLLISRANTRELVGSAAVVEQDYPTLMLCDKLYRVRFHPDLCCPWFISRYLGSTAVRGQIELRATGASASMVNIPQSAILDLVIAAPPIEEQRNIIASLDLKFAKLDTLTAEAQRAIDLLQERRTALISAAVTGQIDVRPAVAR